MHEPMTLPESSEPHGDLALQPCQRCSVMTLSRAACSIVGTVLCGVLLLCGWQATCASEEMRIPPQTIGEMLNTQHAIFIGTLDSVVTIRYIPRDDCGYKLSPAIACEYSITVDSVLAGGLIGDNERVRSLSATLPVGIVSGARVLAYGRRICPDGWKLWGNVAAIGDSGELMPHSGLPARFQDWEKANGRRFRLADLTESHDDPRVGPSMANFRHVSGLKLVRVESRAFLSDAQAVELECSLVRKVLGPPATPGNIRLRFAAPHGVVCDIVEPGDTLVVPNDLTAAPGAVVQFESCIDWCVVKQGYVPSLAIPVARLQEAYSASGEGRFQLRSRMGAGE